MKKPKGKWFDALVGLVAIVVLGWAAVTWLGDDEAEASASAAVQAAEIARCIRDIECLGNKGITAAGIYCKSKIERAARGDVKWTDGTLENKFSRFRWKDEAAGVVTYIGDRVQFQNAFGAYLNVIYECDMKSDRETVLDVRVREGRL